MSGRKGMGKAKKDVLFPIAPNISEVGNVAVYTQLRDSVVALIKDTRIRLVVQANSGMMQLYWRIGQEIIKRQSVEGWGTKVIDRLSKDLSDTFPDMKGFSPRNLKYMRKLAECWRDTEIVQRVVAQIPWRSNIILLDKLSDNDLRLWYAQKLLENGWSSNVLALMIESRLIERQGKAINNFEVTLPSYDSDYASYIFKDPYLFDFLGTGVLRRETEVERSLVTHIEKFLLELGQGFAFVGRQVHLELGGDDFYIDILFYHLKLRCYIVIELKAREFDPGFLGQLSMYQSVVDDVLRHPDDKPTIGLLLVKGKNKTVVEYSLSGYTSPLGVADWQEKLSNDLPEEFKSSLPTIEEIEKELEASEINGETK